MELSATKTGTFWISKQIFASFQKVVTESLAGILIVCVLGVLIIFYSKTFWINYRTHGTLKRQFKNRLNGTEIYFQNTSSCSLEDITNIYKKVRLGCVFVCVVSVGVAGLPGGDVDQPDWQQHHHRDPHIPGCPLRRITGTAALSLIHFPKLPWYQIPDKLEFKI